VSSGLVNSPQGVNVSVNVFSGCMYVCFHLHVWVLFMHLDVSIVYVNSLCLTKSGMVFCTSVDGDLPI